MSDEVGPIGPAPTQWGGPEILFGGWAPAALRRVGRWGDGYFVGVGDPHRAQDAVKIVEESWREAGRLGSPRLVGGVDCAIGGPGVYERGAASVYNYYKNRSAEEGRSMIGEMIRSPHQVRQAIEAAWSIGMDEVIYRPHVEDLEQIDRLAEVVG